MNIMNEFMTRQRISAAGLHEKTGVPVFRIRNLQIGIDSLRNCPFSQCCRIANALEVPLEIWYTAIMSDDYTEWIRNRRLSNCG